MTNWRSVEKWSVATVLAILCIHVATTEIPTRVSASARQQNQSTQAGKVSGHVFRADTGAPLHKATVNLSGRQQQSGSAEADKTETVRTAIDGSFSFSNVPSGTYTIRVERTGYVGQFYGQAGAIPTGTSLSVGAGQDLENIDVHLTPAGVISGTVFDEDNEPLEGVQVTALHLRYSRGGHAQEVSAGSTQTDDLGNYRLSGLTPGAYFVRTGGGRGGVSIITDARSGVVYGTRYYPGTRSLEEAQRVHVGPGAEAGGIQFSVTPEKTFKITGTILDATDNPAQRRYTITAGRIGSAESGLAGDSGSIFYSTGNGLLFTVGSSLNPDGSFVIKNVVSGEYLLTARAIDQNMQMVRGSPAPRVDVGNATVRVADADAHTTVQIGRPNEVRGQAILENPPGPPLTSFRLGLQGQSVGGGRGGPASLSLDGNGDFDFKDVVPGRYGFSVLGGPSGSYIRRAICGGRDNTFLPLVLETNATLTECSIMLATDAGTLSGQVLDGTKPAPGLMVVAIPLSREERQVPRYTMTANSDGNGQYVITGVIPGEYYMFAAFPDEEQSYFALDYPERNQANAELVTVKSNESKTVKLKPSTPQ